MFFPEQTAIWLSHWTWLTSLTSRTCLKSTPFAFFFLMHIPFFFFQDLTEVSHLQIKHQCPANLIDWLKPSFAFFVQES